MPGGQSAEICSYPRSRPLGHRLKPAPTESNGSDVNSYQGVLSAAELKELQNYLSLQPDAPAIKAMAQQARDDLADKRAWALVHYLKSLVAP